MHCLLPIITLLIPLALAFPKHGSPEKHSKHHDDAKHSTSFPTLTIPSTSFTGLFPTGFGTGTVTSFPTVYATGDFKMRRDMGVLEGRKWSGKFNGTSGCAKPTGKKHTGKKHDD